MSDFKPSDLTIFPRFSALWKYECECVACDIVTILAHTGDTFRILSFAEFSQIWPKIEKPFSDNDYVRTSHYFDLVIPFFESAEKAATFSMYWDNLYRRRDRPVQV